MNKPASPYRLKQPGDPHEELVLIQLQDHDARPPASVGVDFLSGFLFGSIANQPSRSPERKLTWGVVLILSGAFVAMALWLASVLRR